VDASVFPSELNAAAIVDLGGGIRGQYFADQRCKDCDSALCTASLEISDSGQKMSDQTYKFAAQESIQKHLGEKRLLTTKINHV
jgi:hypothetical protein